MRRDSVLQRCFAVLPDRCTHASRSGADLALAGMRTYTAVPRMTLYAADLQDKRHLLGLRLGKCFKPFSECMVDKDICGMPEAVSSPTRHVTENLEVQLEAAALFEAGIGADLREQISRDFSALHFVPALAAVHSLGTASKSLYDIFGFDSLHVRYAVRLSPRARATWARTAAHRCILFSRYTSGAIIPCCSIWLLPVAAMTGADVSSPPPRSSSVDFFVPWRR